jgi:ElaB/YqjD/DUF883 family membrane-anchored ribosome-binding protein
MFTKGAHMRFRKANTADLANDLSQLLDDLKEVLASKGRDADPAASLLFSKAASTLEKVRTASSNAVCESRPQRRLRMPMYTTHPGVRAGHWRLAH